MITGLTRNGPTTRRPSASGHVGSGRSSTDKPRGPTPRSTASPGRPESLASRASRGGPWRSIPGSLAGVTGSRSSGIPGPRPGPPCVGSHDPRRPPGSNHANGHVSSGGTPHAQSWVQSSVISNARSPLRILIAPWSTPLGVLPADRHPHLLADGTIAVIQRRCLRDDRLVQHQDYPARAILQAAFQPPFAWRQVSGRAANSCRGRFQRRPRRAIATLMLLTEALIP